MPEIKFIAAIDDRYGLAKNGRIPWDLPSDRKYFYDMIVSGPLLMGWKTFADNKHKPFRSSPKNIVLTHRDAAYQGIEIIHDLDDFVNNLKYDLWVSGSTLYEQLLPHAAKLYLTRVSGNFDTDVFFPKFEDKFILVEASSPQSENGIVFVHQIWEPKSKSA